MEREAASCVAILGVLHEDNYVEWSIRVKTYLMAQDVWDIVEATMEPPKQEDGAAFKVWSKKNNMALHIIQNSCGTDTFYEIRKIVSAKIAWDTLAGMYSVPKDTNSVVCEVLGVDNYEDWSARVKSYLKAYDLWDIVEVIIEPTKQDDDHQDEAFKAWNKKNFMVLSVIQNSCGPDTFSHIREITSAKIAWDTLAGMHNVPKNTNSVVREVLEESNYKDWSARIKTYLMAHDLWDAVEVIIEPPKQEDDQDHDAFKAWNKKNYMALSVIKNSCGLYSFSQIREITSAKIVWDTLAGMHNVPKNTNSVVHEVLGEDNYEDWSAQLKTYLMAHDLWDIIEQTTEPNTQEDDGVIALEACNNKNLIALVAIKNSCGPDTFSQIREITSAKIAWDTLAEKYSAGTNNVSVDADLCKALRSGNWTAAKEILERQPNAVGARITHKGDTALHIAVAGGHFRVVDELVKLMPEQNLETLEFDGLSALSHAAIDGKIAMAQCMLRKNEKLINIPSSSGDLPVYTAISFGHIETARYLYSLTPPEDLLPESGYDGANLFIEAISTGTLDIALDLLQRCPRLTLAEDQYGNHPLVALASAPHLFPSGSLLVFWKRWIYKYCIHIQPADSIINETRLNIQKVEKHQRDQVNTIISVRTLLRNLLSNVLNFLGIEQLYEMKLIHVQSHKLLCQMCEVISNSNEQERMDSYVHDAIICAIKSGIIEFVSEMLKESPEFLWTKDPSKRSIFSLVVLHRQAKILSLLLELHLKNALTCSTDVDCNGMLHMAGMSAESTMLNRIPGAALQMQKEVQWFKEVETIVHPKVREEKNKDGLTPRELFTNQHKAMLKAGEQWMKDTATSCTVVGALIVTIMFAAAFTIPGGNKQDTGLPLFLQEDLFTVFIISDALSLFSSSTSVIIFLGILTSRYAEDDFLRSLPTKMIIGLSTLFFSIATMMMAFSATILIMLRGQSWIVHPIICLASVPVALFVMMQFRLLVEMFISTYGPGILNRKIKLTFN